MMSKEQKLDNLLKQEKEWTAMFDSDVRVAMALLEEIRKLNQNKDKKEVLPKVDPTKVTKTIEGT